MDVFDVKGRIDIFKVYVSNKKFVDDVFLDIIVMRIFGFSGVDFVNLLNEVVILMGRRGKFVISVKEIDDLIDRIVVGMEGIIMIDGKSKSFVVYYEVGYVICG